MQLSQKHRWDPGKMVYACLGGRNAQRYEDHLAQFPEQFEAQDSSSPRGRKAYPARPLFLDGRLCCMCPGRGEEGEQNNETHLFII